MKLNNAPYNGKTKSVSFTRTRVVTLIKFFKNAFLSLRRHTDAVIRDLHTGAALRCAAQLDPHIPAGVCKFDRIGEQIQPELLKQFNISAIIDPIKLDIQFDRFCAPLSFQKQNTAPQLFIQRKIYNIFCRALIFQAG